MSITMLVKGSGWWTVLVGDILIGIFQLLRGGERMGDKNRGNAMFPFSKSLFEYVYFFFFFFGYENK